MSLFCKICLQLTLLSLLTGQAPPAASPAVSDRPVAASQPMQPAPAFAPMQPAAEAAPLSQGPVSATIGTAPPGASVMATEASPALSQQVAQAQQQLQLVLSANPTGRATEAVLVVPSRPEEAQSINPLVEDLTIMSRIIQKNLADGYLLPEISAMDSLIINLTLPAQNAGPRLFFPSTWRAKPMYVSGYGALFFLQVDFPLVAPAEQGGQTSPEESDPVWSEARRALYEPPGTGLVANPAPAESYSEDKVALLRGRLIELLKHATNIRTLDPNESITIVVRGTATGEPNPPQNAVAGLPSEVPCGRTVLSLRVKKADIDLYAKDQMDPAQFEQRVQITTYKQ